MLQDNAESYFAETYDEYPLKVSNIDVDRIMDLAEKSRNALNDVAHLCSGEVEEHIFDMGFYQGYKKRNGEINIK